jgi:hypothetical protein
MTYDHVLNLRCSTDEGLKAGAHLSDVLFDPKLAFSQETEAAPLNVAFKTNLWYYPWYESEGNEYRRLRFNQSMNGSRHAVGSDAILEGRCCLVNFPEMPLSLSLSLLQASTGRALKIMLLSSTWAEELEANP